MTTVPPGWLSRCLLAGSLLAIALLPPGVLAGAAGQAPNGMRPQVASDETTRWRADREAQLRAENGWLSVAGLFFPQPGVNSMGSAPGSQILLPRDAAPARLGTVTLRDGRISFEIIEPIGVMLNGRPALTGDLRPASPAEGRPPDVLKVGRLTLQVHVSGTRQAIRLRDPENPVRTTFTGLRWFPVDPAWRLEAEFVPFSSPRRVTTLNVLGDELEVASPGVVRFTIGGQPITLLAFEEGRKLWFVFTDATAGVTTYKAARFLYADPPKDGRVLLDFNRAENPPCAYNPFTTCPLPPRENRVALAITAGERDYPNRYQPR